MSPELLPALIAGIAAILAALITAYSHEIKSLVLGRYGQNSDLKGRWDCKWTEEGQTEEISDSVEIIKVAGERIIGKAHTPEYGDYLISGRVSASSLITMHYEGAGRRKSLGGVVLLKLNAARNQASGIWHEFSEGGEIEGGSTFWNKRGA